MNAAAAFAAAVAGAAFVASGAVLLSAMTDREVRLARIYDKSSTRELLKQQDLNKYMEKKKEFAELLDQFRRMSVAPNVDNETIAERLKVLRVSPFYDSDACASMYKNLWVAIEVADDTRKIPQSRLDSSAPCLARRKRSEKLEDGDNYCTKQELIRDLYVALHDDRKR